MNVSIPPPGRFPRLHTRPPAATPPLPPGLDARSAAVLREIVEQYVETGEPVGSRTLARRLPMSLSPATIRNVMADLTDSGLLFAPHTSVSLSAEFAPTIITTSAVSMSWIVPESAPMPTVRLNPLLAGVWQ